MPHLADRRSASAGAAARLSQRRRIRDYRELTTHPEGHALRERLEAWASSDAANVGNPWPRMPGGVTDRPADVWEPLLAVAELAGDDWSQRARTACLAFAGCASDDAATVGTRLLTDLHSVFGDADVLSTETIWPRYTRSMTPVG